MKSSASSEPVPTLDEVMEMQRYRDLCHVHLVYLGEESFHLAHTDEERAEGTNTPDCPLHVWLTDQDGPPQPVGVYVVVPHEVDAYSEPYPVAEWDFCPLDLWEALCRPR